MKIEADITIKELENIEVTQNELNLNKKHFSISSLSRFYGTGGGNFGDKEHGGNIGGIGTLDIGVGGGIGHGDTIGNSFGDNDNDETTEGNAFWGDGKWSKVDKGTKISITQNADFSYDIDVNKNGLFNDEIAHESVTGQTTYGGSLASTFADIFGTNAKTSITTGAILEGVVEVALGHPELLLDNIADILGVHGIIGQKVANTLNFTHAVVGFSTSTLRNMKSLSSIQKAHNLKILNTTETILAAAAVVYSQYNSMQNFTQKANELGFGGVGAGGFSSISVNIDNLNNINIDTNNDNAYGISFGKDNLTIGGATDKHDLNHAMQEWMKMRFIEVMSGDITDYMAGGSYFNEVQAGGDMFQASHPVGSNLIACVTGKNKADTFTQMLWMQEEYIANKFHIGG